MTATAPTLVTLVTHEDRLRLAEIINGRPLPEDPIILATTIERDMALDRADTVIADGWAPTQTPPELPADLQHKIAEIISGAPFPSARSLKKADAILALIWGQA